MLAANVSIHLWNNRNENNEIPLLVVFLFKYKKKKKGDVWREQTEDAELLHSAGSSSSYIGGMSLRQWRVVCGDMIDAFFKWLM